MATTRKISNRQWWLLYYGWKDPSTPWYAKLTAVAAVLYLISPIDVIPDFIPVAGLVDDVFITPLLLSFATSMLPESVREQAMRKATLRKKQIRWVVILLVVFVVALIVYWIIKRH